MKIKKIIPLVFLLTGCNLLEGRSYEFAYMAMEELNNKVDYIETVEIKNALYHSYKKNNELPELVVFYYTYDDNNIENLDAYAMYSFDKETGNYEFSSGDQAEMYFYFATGMDHKNYESLDVYLLNKYITNEIII